MMQIACHDVPSFRDLVWLSSGCSMSYSLNSPLSFRVRTTSKVGNSSVSQRAGAGMRALGGLNNY